MKLFWGVGLAIAKRNRVRDIVAVVAFGVPRFRATALGDSNGRRKTGENREEGYNKHHFVDPMA